MAENPTIDPPVKKPASGYDQASNWLDGMASRVNPYANTGFLEPKFVPFEQTRKYIDQDFGYFQGADIEDFYAQRQSGLEKLAEGFLVKLPLTAITKTFAGAGYLVGLANPVNWFAEEGYFNAVADNAISGVFNKLEDQIKTDWLPTFQEAADRDKGFFSRAFTDIDFWSEDFVDGAAFMASAFVPGIAASKLGLGVKLAQAASRAAIGLDAAAASIPGLELSAANYLRNASNLARGFDKATIVALNSSSEAMVEAKSVRDNVLASLKDMNMSEEDKKGVAGKAARNAFLMNVGLLGATNLLELNYLYKVLGKTDDVARGVISGNTLTETASVFEPTSRLGKFLNSNKGAFLKGAGASVLREGLVEENMQLAIQRLNEEYGKAGKALTLKEYYKVFDKYKDQTLAALSGDDTEASMNIGMGGLLGGIMGGAGDVMQARRDRDFSKQAVDALNTTQNNWLKFSNIYQTETQQITNDKGEVETKTRIKLDQLGNPVVDETKLATVVTDLKLNLDALNQSRLASSPLEQSLFRNHAFSQFVQAHINAGIENTLFEKLESARKATPEDLIKLGFDPENENIDKDIEVYKKIATDIINQNKLINRDILFTGRESDAKRKQELISLASRQAVSKVLASQLQTEADEIRNNFTTPDNSSLTDTLVDQLNDLKVKILKQERKIDDLKSNPQSRQMDVDINEKVLSELQAKYDALQSQNPEQLALIKQDEEGFFQYEKAERNDPNFLNNYIRKISHKADFENNIQSLGAEFGMYADAIKGADNFDNAEKELSDKIESLITEEDEQIIDPDLPGTTITYTDENGVEQKMEFKPGQIFVGKMTQVEKYRGLGKSNVTQFNNDKIKIHAISEDGNTVTVSINGDGAIDIDAIELAKFAKEQNWRDYNSLTDIQKAYLSLRNKIIRYRVIAKDANGKFIKGENGKYVTEVVSGRVSLGGTTRNEIKFKYVNPRTGKVETIDFDSKYVLDKIDITGLPEAEQVALEAESARIAKNYETQINYLSELIQETEAGLAQAESRRKANAEEFQKVTSELEGLKETLENVETELQANPYVRGRKSAARKNLEKLQSELPNKITEAESLLNSLQQEKQDLENLFNTLNTSRDLYYSALGEIEETGQPFDRAGKDNLGEAVSQELAEAERTQLTKRFDEGQLDKMISQTQEEIEQIDNQVGLLQRIVDNAKTLLSKIMSYKELYDTLDDPNIDDNTLRFRLVQLKKDLQQRIQQKREQIIQAGGDPNTTAIYGDDSIKDDQNKLEILNAFIKSNNSGLGIGAAYTRKLVSDLRDAKNEIDSLTSKRDELTSKLLRLETAVQQKEYINTLRDRLNFLNQVQQGLGAKARQAKERQEMQQKINAAQASIRAGLADGLIDDTFNDSDEKDNEVASPFEDPKPVFDLVGMMKTFGRHITSDKKPNSENANDRFYKFTDSNSVRGLFLMPVTKANDTFGIRREDQFKDDIKLVVVRKVGNEYKYVGVDGQILESPTKDNIVYTSMGGNPVLLGADKTAAFAEIKERFSVKDMKATEVIAKLDSFIALRNQIKDRISKGESVYLPITSKGRGVQAILPKDEVTGRPQQHNLDGRLVAEEVDDWTNPKHPDGTPIKLEVATTERVQNTRIPLGRPVIVKDNTVFRVYNSDLTQDQKNNVIEALKVLSKLFPRKSDPKNPLNQDEERDFNDIIRYLSGVVYWSLPDKKDTIQSAFNANRLYVYTDPNTGSITLFRGIDGYVFNETQIEANRDKIVNGLKHNVSNPLLSGKRKDEPFYDLSIKDGKVTRARKYTNYQHYMLEPREDGTSPIYTNVPLYSGKEGMDTQMNSVYLNYSSDIVEPGAPASNPIEAKKEFVSSTKRSASEMPNGRYRFTAETGRGVKFTVTFGIENGTVMSDYTTQASEPDGSPYQNLDALNKVVGAITESIVDGTLNDLISESGYKNFEMFEEGTAQEAAPVVTAQPAPVVEAAPVVPATSQPEINDSALAAILNKYSTPQFDEDTNYRVINMTDFIETEDFAAFSSFMEKALPQIGVKKLGTIIDNKAWGQFKNGIIYLYENAEIGTGYHEAFEAVWNSYLTAKEQKDILDEVKARPGYQQTDAYINTKRAYPKASEDQIIKEMIAEEFRAYVLDMENDQEPKSLGKKIMSFFKDLYNFIKKWLGLSQEDKDILDSKVNQLFAKIVAGEYANAKPVRDLSTVRSSYRTLQGTTPEFTKEAVDGLTSSFFMNLYRSKNNIDALFLDQDNNKLFVDLLNATMFDENSGVIGKLIAPFRGALGEYENTIGRTLDAEEKKSFMHQFSKVDPNIYYKLYLATNLDAQKEIASIFKTSLEKYGFTFKEKIDEEDFNAVMSKESTVENPLGILDSINIDPRKMTAANVKMLIASLTDDVYVNGEIKPQTNALGLLKPVNYGKVLNTLLNELNSTVSVYRDGVLVSGIDLMFEKLDKKFKVDGKYKDGYVWIQRLKSRLKLEDFSGQKISADTLTEDDIRLMISFEKNFTNNQNIPLKIVIGNENAIYNVNPVDSVNERRVRDTWENNIKDTAKPESKKDGKSLIYIDSQGKIVFDKDSQDFYTVTNAISTEDRINALKLMGIEFSYPQMIIDSEGQGGQSSLSARLNKAYNSIVYAFTTDKEADQINNFDDLFGRQKVNRSIGDLLRIEAEMTGEDNILSHQTADGKTQYSITIPSTYANVLNSLRNVETQADFIRSNPHLGTVDASGNVTLFAYQGNSRLLGKDGLIFDKNGRKRKDINYHLISGIGMQEDGAGKPTDKLQFTDRVVQEIHYIMNGIFYTPINSDKASEFGLETGVMIDYMDAIGSIKNNQTVIDLYIDALEDELDAAIFERDSKPVNKIQYYKDAVFNLGHFNNIIGPKLLKRFQDKVLTGKETKESFLTSYDVTEAIGNYLEKQTKEVLDALTDIDVFTRTESETGVVYSTKAIGKENLAKIGISDPTNISESSAINIAQFLMVNKQLSVFEQHKLIYGHPALYKDFAKRSNGATSTKEAIVDNPVIIDWMDKNMRRIDKKVRSNGSERQTFNVVSYKDIITASDYIKDIDTYKELKEADAQAWIMPDMYRDLLFLSSKWTKEMEDQWQYEVAYEIVNNKSNSSKYTQEEKNKAKQILKAGNPKSAVFPVLKPQYFGYSKNQMTHTVFLKNSVQPKFFRMVQGTAFEKVYNNALNNQVDVIGFESGQKVGNILDKNNQFVSLYDNSGAITDSLPPVQTLFTKFFGIQVEQPAIFKDLVVRGTQVTKLIMSNFLINGKAINQEVEDLIKEYNQILQSLVTLGKAELLEELGLSQNEDGSYQTVDLQNLVNLLKNEAEKRNLPDNIIESIALDPENNKLQTPFDALPNREKIDNVINSIIDSRVISDKMNGKPLVQVSSTGYEFENRKMVYLKDGVYTEVTDIESLTPDQLGTLRTTSSDLKFYRMENGKIAGMEVYLPWYFKNVDPEKLGLEKGRGNIYTVKPGAKIDERLLRAIGFRIPTQGMNSIENIVIKGFLPQEAGDMVVVPSEIVGKAGSDFDIDKLNTYLGNYYFQNGRLEYIDPSLTDDQIAELEKSTGVKNIKKKALQNRLIEVMSGLMSQPENMRQLVQPNGSAKMKAMAQEIKDLKGVVDEEKSLTKMSEFIPMAITRERYVTGKKLVGIAALQTTSHTMFQVAGIELSGSYPTRGLKFMHGKNERASINIRLDHGKNAEGNFYLYADKGIDGNYISDMHSEGLTGFVDTANDPFIFDLNLSIDSAASWFYLQKLQVPLDQISYLYAQPILEKYFKEASKNKTVLRQATKSKLNSAIVIGKVLEPYIAAIQGKKFVPYLQEMMDKPRASSKLLSKVVKPILTYRKANPKVTLEQLKKSVELGKKDTISREEAFIQASILMDYLEYNKQASHLTNFIRAIGYDNTSTKNIIENRLQDFNWITSEKDAFIANPEAILEKTFIGEMRTQKQDVFNMYKEFFVSLDPRSAEVFRPLFEKFTNPDFFMLNEDKQEVLDRYQNFYINYLIQTVPYAKDGVQTTINQNYKLLFGSQSVAHQLKKLQKSKDPKIKNNLFLKELFPLMASETAKTNNVKLFRKRLDTYENNIIIDSAANLYDYSLQTANKELQKLVEDIAVLAILQSGVQNSPISYTKILPVQIYSKVVSSIINSFRQGSVDIDPKLVWKQFHQNNWRNADIVPVKDKAVVENGLLVDNSDNDYVLHRTIKPGLEQDKKKLAELRSAGKWDDVYDYTLYERIPFQDIYRPINKLGDSYRFTEVYAQDRKKSMLLSNKPFDEAEFDNRVLGYLDSNSDVIDEFGLSLELEPSQPVITKTMGVKIPTTKIISGGQTGVDRIGLEVGLSLNYQTGGTATPGFKTETGRDESLKGFGVEEISTELQAGKSGREFYLPRTEQNVINSDGTVYFATDEDSAGKKATERFARQHNKPFLLNPTAAQLRDWLSVNNIQTLNVAGNRGSKLTEQQAKTFRDILTQALDKSVSDTQSNTYAPEGLPSIENKNKDNC